MQRRLAFKIFTCFLGVSFFFMMAGFPANMAYAQEKSLPIGEMVSRGDVKFEAKERVWKNVERSYFPIFQGMKIKTEKGAAIVSLAKQNQMEVGQNTILFFEKKDQARLSRGNIDLRLSSKEDLRILVGHLTVIKSPALQAAMGSAVVSPRDEVAIGSLSLHPNGSLTIKSTRGQLTVLNSDRKVLAALSPKESLTIPSAIAEKPAGEKAPPVMLAQVGEEEPAAEPEKYAGLSAKTWGVVGLVTLGAGLILAVAGGGGGGGGGGETPICP